MTDGEVRYRRDGEIATVIFDRPAARNAMTWRMYEQLDEACSRIRGEHGLRVAVFRGAGGKAFVAGTDIAQFQAFRGGDVQVLANCGVLTEGFDEATVACIIIARPTQSRALYLQMVGRGTRRHPGKADCLIIDLVAAATRHELQTTATLFGLAPQAVAQRGGKSKRVYTVTPSGLRTARDLHRMRDRIWSEIAAGGRS